VDLILRNAQEGCNCNRVKIAASNSNELTEVTPTHPKKFEPKSVVHFIYIYIYIK
jgi:hypothetical protein